MMGLVVEMPILGTILYVYSFLYTLFSDYVEYDYQCIATNDKASTARPWALWTTYNQRANIETTFVSSSSSASNIVTGELVHNLRFP